MREYVILDVFTDIPLEGNQLAVFGDGSGLSDDLIQRVAREMNLSETVFLLTADEERGLVPPEEVPPEPGGDHEAGANARLRIFTPVAELAFAGHPVLGAAFVVGSRGVADIVRPDRRGGHRGRAAAPGGGDRGRGDAAADPRARAVAGADRLLAALGVERSGLPVEAYDNGALHVYVELESEAAVAALRPDLGALAELGRLARTPSRDRGTARRPDSLPGGGPPAGHEGELAIVIGADGAIGGYCVAKRRQRARPAAPRAPVDSRQGRRQLLPLRALDHDRRRDPGRRRSSSAHVGQRRQDASTAELIFGPQELVDFIAQTCTLRRGDLILTGTPSGVGMALDPPRFLQSGDVVRIEVDRLGAIEHAVA